MNNFKVGDKLIRIKESCHIIKIGEIVTISKILDKLSFYSVEKGEDILSFKYFELVEESKKIDYRIKGTKIPHIPIGTEFTSVTEPYRLRNFKDFVVNKNFISYGSTDITIDGEECILAEEYPFDDSNYYILKLSDIIKANSNNMENQFKIGDKIKVLVDGDDYSIGDIGEITNISHYGDGFTYSVELIDKNSIYYFVNDEIELFSEPKPETFTEDDFKNGLVAIEYEEKYHNEIENLLRNTLDIKYFKLDKTLFSKYIYYVAQSDAWNSVGYLDAYLTAPKKSCKYSELILNNQTKMKTQKITRKALSEIFPHLCPKYAAIVNDLLLNKDNKFKNEFEIDENLIAEAFNDCNKLSHLDWLNKYFTKPVEFNSSMLKNGEMMKITSGRDNGKVIIKTEYCYVSVTDFNDYWHLSIILKGEKIPSRTKFEIIAK
jgi:hypothetical protein